MSAEGSNYGWRLEGTFINLVLVSGLCCEEVGEKVLTMLSSVSLTLAQVNGDGSSSSAGIAHSTKFARSSALSYRGSEFQKS